MQAQAASPAQSSALLDITARHQQQSSPAAVSTVGSKPSPSKGTAASTAGLVTPADQGIAKADVQEQCMSARTWLRGLAEDCAANVHTPVAPSLPCLATVQVGTACLGLM